MEEAEDITLLPAELLLRSKFAKALHRFWCYHRHYRQGLSPTATIHVAEEIDTFQKLQFESEFQRLSPR